MSWSAEKLREYLFYLLVFLLPWQTRYIFYDPVLAGYPWEYGRLSLYIWDVILFILVVWLWPKLWLELKTIWRSSRAFYFYLLLTSLAFFTGGWATETVLVSYWGLRLLEGGAVWLIVRIIKPKISLVFWALASAGLIQAVWGWWQFSTQTILANKWLGVAAHPVTQGGTSVLLNEGGRWLRAYGGQAHPNILGGLLVVTSLAMAWLFMAAKKKSERYIIASFYVIQLIGLFLSFSRAAWLSLFLSLALGWQLIKDKRRLNLVAIFIATVVFVVMGASLWQPTRARLIGAPASQLEKQAIEERVTGLSESKSLLGNAWWRGVGIGNYTKALALHSPGLPGYVYQPVHNILLLILTELGLAGLVFWLMFVWQRLVVYPKKLMLFLVPIGVTLFFDHYWWTSASMMLIFWLIMALPEINEGEP